MDNTRQTFFTITCFNQMVLAAVVALPSSLRKVPNNCNEDRDLLLRKIDPKQFGFIPGSNTTLALISMIHMMGQDLQ